MALIRCTCRHGWTDTLVERTRQNHHHQLHSCSRLISRSTRLRALAASQMMAGRDEGGGTGSARRRRERRLRSVLRHERMAVAVAWPRVCTAHSARRRPGPERWRSRTGTKRCDDRRLLHRGCGHQSCRIPRRRGVLGSTVASAMSSFGPRCPYAADGGTACGRLCAGFPRGGGGEGPRSGVHGVGPFWLLQVPGL